MLIVTFLRTLSWLFGVAGVGVGGFLSAHVLDIVVEIVAPAVRAEVCCTSFWFFGVVISHPIGIAYQRSECALFAIAWYSRPSHLPKVADGALGEFSSGRRGGRWGIGGAPVSPREGPCHALPPISSTQFPRQAGGPFWPLAALNTQHTCVQCLLRALLALSASFFRPPKGYYSPAMLVSGVARVVGFFTRGLSKKRVLLLSPSGLHSHHMISVKIFHRLKYRALWAWRCTRAWSFLAGSWLAA